MGLGQKILSLIRRTLRRYFVYEVKVHDYNVLHHYLETWIAHNNTKKNRRVEAQLPFQRVYKTDNYYNKDKVGDIVYAPRDDWSILWYKRLPIIVVSSKVKLEGATQSHEVYKYEITLIGLFTGGYVKKFINEVYNKQVLIEKENNLRYVYRYSYSSWQKSSVLPNRSLSSVYYRRMDELINTVDSFIKSEAMCDKLGIPWKLGLYFNGAPRTGKTSIVKGLAYKYDRGVYILDLKSIKNDSMLQEMIGSIPDNSGILLIEDYESFFKGRDPQPGVEITYSGFLNALDGVAYSRGLITVVTTNLPEEVYDEALMNSGRLDYTFEFPKHTIEDVENYCKLVGVDVPKGVTTITGVQEFIKNKHGLDS